MSEKIENLRTTRQHRYPSENSGNFIHAVYIMHTAAADIRVPFAVVGTVAISDCVVADRCAEVRNGHSSVLFAFLIDRRAVFCKYHEKRTSNTMAAIECETGQWKCARTAHTITRASVLHNFLALAVLPCAECLRCAVETRL